MEFNKVKRGAIRECNDEQTVYAILDAGFLCHVAFQHEGLPMMVPTAYGRIGDIIYLHGSHSNFMLKQICNGGVACISVTHLDGIVLARNLFHSSANYRSVVIFGKGEVVTDANERIAALNAISDQIAKGRLNDVPLGTPEEIQGTQVVRVKIDSASAKVRDCMPMKDDDVPVEVWSGVVPLRLTAGEPQMDGKFGKKYPETEAIAAILERFK